MSSEDVLVHQVHPAKLAADLGAAGASTVLLWRGMTRAGLLVRYFVPPVASALVLKQADLPRLRYTAPGRYVLAHMPAGAVALRITGDIVMTAAAVRRSRTLLLAGVLLVTAGWSHGLLPKREASAS